MGQIHGSRIRRSHQGGASEPAGEGRRVLVVEDDREIAELVALHLRDLGLSTTHAGDGTEGFRLAREERFELIILDLMLPGMDGIELCRRMRNDDPTTPIIMLTAKSQELDKIMGLETGADDYITKPFSVRELIARVRAVLRRTGEQGLAADASRTAPTQHSLDFGEVRVDREGRRVYVSGTPVELTTKEFDLLVLLAESPGRAYSRRQLLELVWGYNHEGYSHTVNSHINRLRSKIEPDPGNPKYVQTVWGFGYRFAALAPEAEGGNGQSGGETQSGEDA